MKRRKIVISIAVLAAAFSLVIIYSYFSRVSLAYNISSDAVSNNFTNGNIFVYVDEKVSRPLQLNILSSNSKPVTITNRHENDDHEIDESTVDSVVRVTIIARWVEKTSEGKIVPWAGDSDVVNLNYVDDYDQTYVKTKGEYSVENDLKSQWWIADGTSLNDTKYFYYNQILKPKAGGYKTRELLDKFNMDFSKIQANIKAGNNNIVKKYENYQLIIDIKAEAVMVNPEAIKSCWGIDTEKQDDKIGSMLKRLCDSEENK